MSQPSLVGELYVVPSIPPPKLSGEGTKNLLVISERSFRNVQDARHKFYNNNQVMNREANNSLIQIK
jgi:hypothetical protein